MGCNFTRKNETIHSSSVYKKENELKREKEKEKELKSNCKIDKFNANSVYTSSPDKLSINKKKLLTEADEYLSKNSKSKSIYKYDVMNPHNTKRSTSKELSRTLQYIHNKKDIVGAVDNKDFKSFLLTYSKASRTELFSLKCFKQKFVEYMQSQYSLKTEFSTTALKESTILYNILKDNNESFDNRFINLFCCTNIKIKPANNTLCNNSRRSIVSIKSSGAASMNLNNKRNPSLESLSMKNIRTNNNSYKKQLKVYNELENPKVKKTLNSKLSSQVKNSQSFLDLDLEVSSEEMEDSFDYEFSNLVLIGTTDPKNKLYLKSLAKTSDNEDKQIMINDFEFIYSTMNNLSYNSSLVNTSGLRSKLNIKTQTYLNNSYMNNSCIQTNSNNAGIMKK